jgi:hypothetical protein
MVSLPKPGEVFTVAFGFHIVTMDESEGSGVDAVTQSAAVFGTVFENVAKMAIAGAPIVLQC